MQWPIGTQEQSPSACYRSVGGRKEVFVELVSQYARLLVAVVQMAHIHRAAQGTYLLLQCFTAQRQKECLDGRRGDGEQKGLVFVDQEGQQEGTLPPGFAELP